MSKWSLEVVGSNTDSQERRSSPMQSHLYTPREAAEHLKLTEGMLAHWRQRGLGPDYIRIGHHTVRYTLEALEAFVSKHNVIPSEG